jgi:Ribonuclease-III-like
MTTAPNPAMMLTETDADLFRTILAFHPDSPLTVQSLPTWQIRKYSCAGAAASLERMVSAGLLERSAPNASVDSAPAGSYVLPASREGFVRLVQTYFSLLARSTDDGGRQLGSYFLATTYAHQHLTIEFVRAALEERGVMLPELTQPVHGLIQISPTALSDFLGPWKPWDPELGRVSSGIDTVEHLLYRWVFDCINDLAETRTVPGHGNVMRASVRPEHTLAQRHEPPLLELCFYDGSIIGFEAGFDTEHLYYQGEDDAPDDIHEVERNPENCWAEVWKDRAPPTWRDQGLEAKLGYSFEDSSLLKQLVEESLIPGVKSKRPRLVKQSATLGDAILEAYLTTELLRRRHHASAQELHEMRKKLAANEKLAQIARGIGLRVQVAFPYEPGSPRLAKEETEMLGDSVEALIGAAYKDGGLKAAHRVARNLLRDSLEEVAPTRRHLRAKAQDESDSRPGPAR